MQHIYKELAHCTDIKNKIITYGIISRQPLFRHIKKTSYYDVDVNPAAIRVGGRGGEGRGGEGRGGEGRGGEGRGGEGRGGEGGEGRGRGGREGGSPLCTFAT